MMRSTMTFRRASLAVICAVAAVVFGWLIGGVAFPFHQYFLRHVALPNLWTTVNLPALVVGVLVAGNFTSRTRQLSGSVSSHSGSWWAI